MFAMLELLPPRRGVVGHLSDFIFQTRPTVCDQNLQGVEHILVQARRTRKGLPPWEALPRAVPNLPWLLPSSCCPPQGFPLVDQTPLSRALSVELARTLLNGSQSPPASRSLLLLDRGGTSREVLPVLLPLAGELWVWTDSPALWHPVEEDLLAQWGAPLQLFTDSARLADGHWLLALAPDGLGAGELLPLPPLDCPVITPRMLPFTGRCQQICGLRPVVPDGLREALPEGVSPDAFAAAVYSCWGALPWGLSPAGGVCGRYPVTTARILSYMDGKTL